jgi:hypothetical protein
MPVFAGGIDKCVVLGIFRAVLPEKRAGQGRESELEGMGNLLCI